MQRLSFKYNLGVGEHYSCMNSFPIIMILISIKFVRIMYMILYLYSVTLDSLNRSLKNDVDEFSRYYSCENLEVSGKYYR